VQLYLLSCNVCMYVQCVDVQHSIKFDSVCHTALAVSVDAHVCYKPIGDIVISNPSKLFCCMSLIGTINVRW
jgi:hypothetical protein